MLSFADCSKLAFLWFFIPNVHQFLRIVYAKWSPSTVFAFDTLYWAIAIEVKVFFLNFCKVVQFQTYLKGILHLADDLPLGSARLHLAKSKKQRTLPDIPSARSA